MKNGVIWIYPCVNNGNDSRARYIKTLLGIGEADDLGSRLGRVSVRDKGAVIIHQGGVGEPRWNAVERRQRHRQQGVGLNGLDPQERFHEIYREIQQVYDDVAGGRHKKSLVDIAVQRALNLASQQRAKVQNGGQASGGADDVPVLCCGGLSASGGNGNQNGENE